MSRKIVSFDFAMSSTEGEIHTNKLSEQRVYTNDTNSVELEFNITDVSPDYLPSVGANAMLYIYMADGSFFVKYAQHLKLDQNRFYYVLTPEEVKRSGMTKVQLIILIGQMEIASPLFDFKIVNGLVKYPIRPVEIRDWDALTTQARLFVEDLQDLTAEEFAELKMDEKLINLERDYAGRLQSTENQLKAKVDKGNVSVNDININLGKLDQRHISDELIAQIAGDAAVNAVPADGSLTTDKYSNGSVTPAKVSFIDSTGYANTILKAIVAGAIGGQSQIQSNNIARIAVFEIEPDKTYTISKEPSSRFRVATTTDFPENGSALNNFYLDEFNQANEQETTKFTFVSKSGDNYLVVYYSNAGESVQVHLAEGDVPEHDFKKVKLIGDINAPNIVRGKNLFDGTYIVGGVGGSINKPSEGLFRDGSIYPHARSFVVILKPNTDYSIYKTRTNRFRIALSNVFPGKDTSLYVLNDEQNGGDNKTTFTLNSKAYKYLIVTVTNMTPILDIPNFVQVEEGSQVTDLETYGYKFYPEAKALLGDSKATLLVESFRREGMSDRVVIQTALDASQGQVVEFESGREYILDDTVTAHASKVRGIIGNNSMIKIYGVGKTALIYEGSKNTYGASPANNQNQLLKETEMSPFIDKLRVTSGTVYDSNGIMIRGLFQINVTNSFIFSCKNGLVFNDYNRNVIISNNHIWDNSETGLLFDSTNIHQLNIDGGHISYNKNEVKFIDSDIANVVFSGASLESGATDAYEAPESIISFEESETGIGKYEVIIISGCNIQEHGNNVKPLVNFDVSNGQIYDLIIGDTLLGNCGPRSVPFYGKKIRSLSINNVNTPSNSGNHSFVFEGAMSQVRVTGSNIQKPLDYNNANISKMIIANNTTVGFTLPDSNDGNILIKDNI